jgi:hypothetical protein
MPGTSLRKLLPAGVTADSSRSDLLQQMAAASLGTTSAANSTAIALGSTSPGGGGASGVSSKELTDQISSLTTQMSSLSSIQQTQTGATQDNTQALTTNTSSKSSGGSSLGSTLGGIASSFLGGGLTLSPLISGLISLFGGGSSQSPAPPLPFKLPPAVDYNAGISAGSPGQATPVSYGEGGQPQAANSAPQISIQVNAMDSQSFLDHSDDIASAVRQAILTSNSLNDVLSEL